MQLMDDSLLHLRAGLINIEEALYRAENKTLMTSAGIEVAMAYIDQFFTILLQLEV
jgi:hypothetical protein